MKTTIENAIIESTMLGVEDHGIFTAFVHVSGHCWGCGFGGYAFDQWDRAKEKRVGGSFGVEFIRAVIKVAGVEKWEDLPGCHVRVETEGLGGGIKRIGNIIKDEWFDPKDLLRELEPTTTTHP